ncbi:MAG: Gfo/Idh/MocA family oxidoreductase [Verrucomicrobiae bacterium]|nr:Gfo/Idh/MocA family oxidoreductase [Verrucomicrobiae bacterium]
MKTTLFFIHFLIFSTALFSSEIKIGIVGLDTSHVIAFTQLLNDTNNPKHIPGARVVCAFKGGSSEIEASTTRIENFTKQMREKFDITIVSTIDELCKQVDVVMIESVDGRKHLEQTIPVFAHKKPMFIDKPLAGSLRDALEIWRLSKKHSVPVFSSSAYRFYESLMEVKTNDFGEIRTVISWGPAALEPHHPDLFWYGIHPTEALFTVLGRGCVAVSRIATKNSDIVSAEWTNSRTATLIGLRESTTGHRVIVLGSKGIAEQKGSGDYAPLVREIVKFFQTGKPPVSLEETVEIIAFMESADESKRQNGAKVSIKDVLLKNGGEDFLLSK